MFKAIVLSIALLFSSFTVAHAQFDQPKVDHSTHQLEYDWSLNIFIKGADLDGCNVAKIWTAHPEITRTTGAKNVMLMIIVSNGVDGGAFMIASDEWVKIVQDKAYKIKFMFDENGKVFELNGNGDVESGPGPNVMASVNDAFIREFARARNIAVWINDVPVGMYPLAGSRIATNQLFSCKKQFPSKKGSTF